MAIVKLKDFIGNSSVVSQSQQKPTVDLESHLGVKDIISSVGTGLKNFAVDAANGTTEAAKSAFEGLQGDVSSGAQALQDSASGKMNPIVAGGKLVVRSGIGTISDLAKLILSPITGTVSASVKNIADATSEIPAVQKLANTKPVAAGLDFVKSLGDKLNEFETQYPEASKALFDTINVALIAAGGIKPKGEPVSPVQVMDSSKIKAAQYYDTLGHDLPLSKFEIDHIEQTNPGLVEAIRSGKPVPPIPVRQAGNGLFEPDADGATRLLAYKHLGVKEIPVVVSNTEGVGAAAGKSLLEKDVLQTKADIEGAAAAFKNSFNAAKNAGTGAAESLFRTAKETIGTAENAVKNVGGIVEKVVAKPIPKAYQTALKETPVAKFDEYSTAAQKATESFKNPTPLELAGTKAQGALDTIQRKLDTIGSQKSGVLEQASVGNKPVGNIVVKFRRDLGNIIRSKTSVAGDSKVAGDLVAEAEKLGPNPTASQVDKFIDYAQERIYTGKRDLTVPVTDSGTAALRQLVGQLNENLKAQLPDSYRALNEKYSNMIDTRNELNLKLGAEGEKGGALMKRVFSPSDANTKKLFADVKKITGVDLVNEATVARFVMEAVGDSRQASLLQQLQLPAMSKQGIIDFVLNHLTKNFNTPAAQLKRARVLTAQ